MCASLLLLSCGESSMVDCHSSASMNHSLPIRGGCGAQIFSTVLGFCHRRFWCVQSGLTSYFLILPCSRVVGFVVLAPYSHCTRSTNSKFGLSLNAWNSSRLYIDTLSLSFFHLGCSVIDGLACSSNKPTASAVLCASKVPTLTFSLSSPIRWGKPYLLFPEGPLNGSGPTPSLFRALV